MTRTLIFTGFLLAAMMQADAQGLRPVLYTDWGRLCSVAVAEAKPVCLPATHQYEDAVWSPDGRRFVDGSGALRDSIGRRVGVLRGWSAIRPVWSPDGQHVFAIDYDLGSAVLRWDADGRARRTVPFRGGDSRGRRFQMISFSPNGRRAALLTMQFREMVIADVGTDALTVTSTIPAGFDYVSQSVWLSDDTLLFVGKRAAKSTGALWRLALATGVVDSVGIPGLSLRDQMVLAPDRQSVVVTAAAKAGETRWNLWYYDLHSRTIRRLTSGTEDIVSSWRGPPTH